MLGIELVLLTLVQQYSAEKPQALLAAEAARNSVIKARVFWSETDYYTGEGSEYFSGVPRYRETRIAPNEAIFANHGTAEGVTGVWHRPEGDQLIAKGPVSRLRAGPADVWETEGEDPIAHRWMDKPARVDEIRSVGMVPIPVYDKPPGEMLWTYIESPEPRVYKEEFVDGRYRVEMRVGEHASVVWYVDPEQGMNITECERLDDGQVRLQALTDYELVNDAWLPVNCVYLNAKGDVLSVVAVEHAQVNEPSLPDRLTPEDIGLANGMSVYAHGGPGPAMGFWVDGRILEFQEGNAEFRAGKFEIAEKVRRHVEQATPAPEIVSAVEARAARAGAATQPASRPVDEWEEYTLAFIRKYGLDEGQTNRALHILRQCQEQRERYLRARSPRMEQVRKGLADTDLGAEKKEKLSFELKAIQAAVQRIFETDLKPRLERLPTRKQRQAAK